MTKKRYLLLFALGLAVAVLVAAFQTAPGYMDADYYFVGGQRLAAGEGLSEMLLWNYLDDPAGLPHPSHTYWMPLTSLAAAAGMRLLPFLPPFEAAQVVFILLTALVPPLTAALAYALLQDTRQSTLAGLLAALPGFYAAFYPTTDSFVLVTLLGGLFFWQAIKLHNWRHFLALGLLAGLLHLARADGLLWLAVVAAAVYLQRKAVKPLAAISAALVGYLLVMGPWYGRNLVEFGSLMPPGGSASLWLLDYDELFSYPASSLTLNRWLEAGLGQLLADRAQALGLNLLSALAVQGVVFLGLLALLGAWQLRRQLSIRLGWLAWGLTLVVMTLVFPFSGSRGGFFHSGAAFMPLVWTLAPLGLHSAINWLATKRGWQTGQAWRVFSAGLVGLALLVSAFTAVARLSAPWDASARQYRALEGHLQSLGAAPDEIVMVNNPPTYFAISQRPAIVIPYGELDSVLQAGQRYHAGYLLLDENNRTLADLYRQPGDMPGLTYLNTFQGFQIYQFDENDPH